MNRQKRFSHLHQIGCIVCRLHLNCFTAPEVHHIRTGKGMSQRATDNETIPLCPVHHRLGDSTQTFQGEIGYHYSPKRFQEKYWKETDLLDIVNMVINLKIIY